MTDQNKTHGVLTDAANELWAAAQLAPGEGIESGVYRIEKILEAKAAPQSPVAPAEIDAALRAAITLLDGDLDHDNAAALRSILLPRIPNAKKIWDESQAFDASVKDGFLYEFDSFTAGYQAGNNAAWQARARLADAPIVSATVPVAWQAARFEGQWHWIGEATVQTYRDAGYMVRELFAAPTPPTSAADALPNVQRLIDAHAKLIEDGNNYAYFELAYTRHTEWMAWLCTNSREHDPERKVIAKGQGSTPDKACLAAIAASQSEKSQ